MPAVLDIPAAVLVPAFPGDALRIPVRLAPNLSLPHGTVLGEQAKGRGVYAPYGADHADGTELARLVLQYDCATDGNGRITLCSLVVGRGPLWDRSYDRANAFMKGFFFTADLVGLDQTSLGQLGRLVTGVLGNGILRMA